jgi:ubiquinone/menaquinone biosynthesis C-methylase UbiE
MNNPNETDIYPRYFRYLFWPLRIFFYLLYHQMAWTYDWVAAAVSIGLWGKWVLSVLPYLDGARCLELGHGPGHLQKAMWSKSGASRMIFGLDASPQMGFIAKRRLRQLGVSPNLVNGVAQSLPFPENVFRTVVATFPTEFIFSSATLSEVYRVLAPAGRLVVLTSALITGKRYPEKTAAWLFKVTGQSSPLDRRLLEPARQAGFRIKVEEIKVKSSVVILLIAEKV